MTEITAYHNPTAPWFREWIAYVVLSDGKLWGVYAIGATEEAAKAKISSLWENEQAKFKTQSSSWDDLTIKDPFTGRPVGEGKQHHFANKVWMRHKIERNLVRVPLTEITMYEGKGYERSGPRSK
jgi:hypothetical protein